MTHTMTFNVYRVLSDSVEGDCCNTIHDAKQSFMDAYKDYWDDDLDEDEAPADVDAARDMESAVLVMGETEDGINTASGEYFSDHPDGVCFGDSGWVMTLPWNTPLPDGIMV